MFKKFTFEPLTPTHYLQSLNMKKFRLNEFSIILELILFGVVLHNLQWSFFFLDIFKIFIRQKSRFCCKRKQTTRVNYQKINYYIFTEFLLGEVNQKLWYSGEFDDVRDVFLMIFLFKSLNGIFFNLLDYFLLIWNQLMFLSLF